MAYFPNQPQEERAPEPMQMQQPKKGGNGGGGGKGKNTGASDDEGDQQQIMMPVIRILNMKSQVNKDGSYSVSFLDFNLVI